MNGRSSDDTDDLDDPQAKLLSSALRTSTCQSMRDQVRIAIDSRAGRYIDVPRTLNDLYALGSAPYAACNPLSFLIRNGHSGQRKLCVAMMEFLSLVQTHQRKKNPTRRRLLVVYVGSSLLAAVAGAEAFPGTKFVCFDPAWKMTVPVFHRESGQIATDAMNSRVRTFKHLSVDNVADALRHRDIVFVTDGAGKFATSTCRSMRDLSARMRDYELVFVSDVRTTLKQTLNKQTSKCKEVVIAEDMVMQAEWVKSLDVTYYSLKLRLPFVATKEIVDVYDGLRKSFSSDIDEPYRRRLDNASTLPYLTGTCVLQKYARNMSTEMRLMGTERPRLIDYNIADVERTFFSFNTIHRKNTRFRIGPESVSFMGTRMTPTLVEHVYRHAERLAGLSDASFDELGESTVLADVASVTAEMDRDGASAESHFARISEKMMSLFVPRRQTNER